MWKPSVGPDLLHTKDTKRRIRVLLTFLHHMPRRLELPHQTRNLGQANVLSYTFCPGGNAVCIRKHIHTSHDTLTAVISKCYSRINTSLGKELNRAFPVRIMHPSEEFLEGEMVQTHTVLNFPRSACANMVTSAHS